MDGIARRTDFQESQVFTFLPMLIQLQIGVSPIVVIFQNISIFSFHDYLGGGFNLSENISQNGSFPQVWAEEIKPK